MSSQKMLSGMFCGDPDVVRLVNYDLETMKQQTPGNRSPLPCYTTPTVKINHKQNR
jgi:hypothetical protein